MKSTDLRAKARAIFGSAIAEPMPKQPNGAKALQQRANARPIPTYKVGGVVKKADGGGMKPKLSTAERKMGDALMMTRKGKEVMSAQKRMEADKEKAMAAKRAKADRLLGITAKKDGGKVQKKAAGGVTDPYGGMPAPLQQPNTSGIGAYPGSTGQVGGAEQYSGAGPRQMQQQISNPNAPATAYKKGGKVKKYATGGIGASLGSSLSKMGMTNAAKPVARQSQGNVRKPMAQGQALQGQALRKYLMGVNPGKPATRPQAGIPLRPKMPGRGSILNPDDIKQVRPSAPGQVAPTREAMDRIFADSQSQRNMGSQTPPPAPTQSQMQSQMGSTGRPTVGTINQVAGTPMKKGGKVQTSSDTARKLAKEMGGMKKGGKAKDGLAVMIAIGSPKKPAKKAGGGAMSPQERALLRIRDKQQQAAPAPRERVMNPKARAMVEAAADKGATGAPRIGIKYPVRSNPVAKVQYKDGGMPVKKAVGGAGKVRKDMMPVKKAQGGAGKVRKGMMSPEGKILDAIGKARGK